MLSGQAHPLAERLRQPAAPTILDLLYHDPNAMERTIVVAVERSDRDLQLWDRVRSLPRRRAAQQLLFTPDALCRALLLS